MILSEADYIALIEAAEDAADQAAVAQFRQKLAAGEEELIPAAVVIAFSAARTASGSGASTEG